MRKYIVCKMTLSAKKKNNKAERDGRAWGGLQFHSGVAEEGSSEGVTLVSKQLIEQHTSHAKVWRKAPRQPGGQFKGFAARASPARPLHRTEARTARDHRHLQEGVSERSREVRQGTVLSGAFGSR